MSTQAERDHRVLRITIARILSVALATAVTQPALGAAPNACTPRTGTVTCSGDLHGGVTQGSDYDWATVLNVRVVTHVPGQADIGPSWLGGHVWHAVSSEIYSGLGSTVIVGTPSEAPTITTTGAGIQGIHVISTGVPPNPPASARDPFLGVFLVAAPWGGTSTDGTISPPSQPGGQASVENYATITTNDANAHGIYAYSNSTGYSTAVTDPLEHFDASAFHFTVTSVQSLVGTSGELGKDVIGYLVDDSGRLLRDADGHPIVGGTFHLRADGTFDFARGSYFTGLSLKEGEFVRIGVEYTVHGTGPNTQPTTDDSGQLVVIVRQHEGQFEEISETHFDRFGYSETNWAGDGHALSTLPDLHGFMQFQLRVAGSGLGGGDATVINHGSITTKGANAYGILAETRGAEGPHGRDGSISHSAGGGGPGQNGGTVHVTAGGDIRTTGEGSVGVLALSQGGLGGHGGEGGTWRYGQPGGPGGRGGNVIVDGDGAIHTTGTNASGILAVSIGGYAGDGGSGSFVTGGAAGGLGGASGEVHVTGTWNIDTTGTAAYGIWAKSTGGNAGSGGSGGWLWGDNGSGGQGSDGGNVSVESGGWITTSGYAAHGIHAQSVGGFGGNGGGGFSLFYSAGGSGASAGSGGNVAVTQTATGRIVTSGVGAHGILAQSVGGGGGSGGDTGGLVAVGGDSGQGGHGGEVTVTNAGRIYTGMADHYDDDDIVGAYGIFAQSVGGRGGDGGAAAGAAGIGGSGAGGGHGSRVIVQNLAGGEIVTAGSGSIGIFAQSVGGGGGNGGNSAGIAAIGGAGSATSAGGEVQVVNRGNIDSTATGLFAQSIGGGGGNGGSSAGWFSFGGKGGGGGAGGNVYVTSSGEITTHEDNANGIFAQSVGGGGGNGGNAIAVGTLAAVAFGGEGAQGGTGGMVVVDGGAGDIETSGDRSSGIFAQSVGGGGGNGGFAFAGTVSKGLGVSLSFGGKAGGGNDANLVTVNSGADIETDGRDAHGIVAQSIGGGGGRGGASVAVSGSDGIAASLAFGGSGGSGGKGGTVTLGSATNPLTGTITTHQQHSYGILAQSIGGGGGDGGFSVAGSASTGLSASLSFGGKGNSGNDGGAVSVWTNNDISTGADFSHGLFAQSAGGGGGSGGLSVAATLSLGAGLGASFGGDAGAGAKAGAVDVHAGGDVVTNGRHAYGIFAQSVGGSGGDGGMAIAGGASASLSVNFAMGGSGGAGGNAGNVTLESGGDITTLKDDSHALFAQSVGGGGGSGGFSIAGGLSANAPQIGIALGGDGGGASYGGNVRLTTRGDDILTWGSRSYGAIAQSVGGSGGDGGFSLAGGLSGSASVNFAMGGKGGGGGAGGDVTLESASDVTTHGNDAHGLVAQSVGGGGGTGGFVLTGGISASSAQIAAGIGGSGGAGAQSGHVTLTTTGGAIETWGQRAYGMLAQSVGGSGGDGGFSIAGGIGKSASINFGMGGTGGGASTGGVVDLTSASDVHTRGEAAHGIIAQSIGGSGGTGGFSITGGISATSAQVAVGIGGKGGVGGTSSAVHLTSTGTLVETEGNRAYGLYAQSVGGGGGDGGYSIAGGIGNKAAVNFGLGGKGGTGGNSSTVNVDNDSHVITLGTDAHGLVAQSIGGGGGAGGLAMAGTLQLGPQSRTVSIGIGGSGGAGGTSGVVSVVNDGAIETFGERAYGVLLQSIGGGGGDGGRARVINKLEDYQAPELPGAPDDEDKDKPKSLSFDVTVGSGGGGGAAGDAALAQLDNSGAITTHGNGSHAIVVQSIGGGGGIGGVSATDGTGGNGDIGIHVGVSLGGNGGAGGTAGAVRVNSEGALTTLGDDAHGIVAQSIGGGGGSGGASAAASKGAGDDAKVAVDLNAAIGGNGKAGGNGAAVTVVNDGTIETSGARSFGVLAQSIGGGGGDGGESTVKIGQEDDDDQSGDEPKPPGEDDKPETWSVGIAIGLGGKAEAGGTGGAVSVTTHDGIITHGAGSHGIVAQSIGGGGGVGGASSTDSSGGSGNVAVEFGFSLGGRGGTGGSAARVDVSNTGIIHTDGLGAHGILAQSIGGGGGNGGTSTSQGKSEKPDEQLSVNLNVAIGGSGSGAGNGGIVTVTNDGAIETVGAGAYAVLAQSIGGGGGQGGLSTTLPGGDTQSTLNLGVSIGGRGGIGGHGSAVTVDSSGAMTTWGDDAIAIFAQSLGGGGGAGGTSVATGGPAKWASLNIGIGGGGGAGNYGDTVTVLNEGDIDTYGLASHGIYAQSIGGGGGRGGNSQSLDLAKVEGGTSLMFGLAIGGSGAGASNGGLISIENTGDIRTRGTGAYGVLAQSIGGGGGEGGYGGYQGEKEDGVTPGLDLQLSIGGDAGSGGNGSAVSFYQTGNVYTGGRGSVGVLLQSIGGGGGVGGFGMAATSFSFTLGGNGAAGGKGGDVDATIDGNLGTWGDGAYGLIAQSIGGGGGAAGNVTAGLKLTEGFALGIGLGGDGGAGGDGGNVHVHTTGIVETHGLGAVGLFAQSVGGGGGLAGSTTGTLPFAGTVGGAGSGGEVTVEHSGDIATFGAGAHGIVAQSAGGRGTASDVSVTVDGRVYTMGSGSIGVVLQSHGEFGNGDLSLELASGGVLFGGADTGTAVRFLDGATNRLLNRGSILTSDLLAGTAIVGGSLDEHVRNEGVIVGSIELGAGHNSLENVDAGLLLTGSHIGLGTGNVLTNAGTLAPGAFGNIAATVIDGNLVNTPTAVQWFDVDMTGQRADSLVIHGDYTADGVVNLLFVSPPKATHQAYELVSVQGRTIDDGLLLSTFEMPVIMTASLSQRDGGTWLDLQPDFSLGGDDLPANDSALGEHLNAIVDAGASPGMQAMLDSLLLSPDKDVLRAALDQLQPTPHTVLATTGLHAQWRLTDAMMSCRRLDGEYRFADEGNCAWARASTWTSTQESTGRATGYHESSDEVSTGVQHSLGGGGMWYGGIAVAYERPQLDDGAAWHSNGSLTQLGAVFKGRMGPFTAALSGTYGTGRYDTRRPVPFLGDDAVARSKQDLTLTSADLRLAYDFQHAAWYLRPLLDVDFTHVQVDRFAEQGAGPANLIVEKQSHDTTALRPAIEVGTELRLESGNALRPFARVGATQVVAGRTSSIAALFAEAPDGVAPFVVENRVDDSYADVLVGLDLVRAHGLSARFTYGGQMSSHTSSYAVGLKLTVPLH